MDEIERFWAVQAIEADLLHRRERLAEERRAARLATYRRRAERAARSEAAAAVPEHRRVARRWWVPGSRAWRTAR